VIRIAVFDTKPYDEESLSLFGEKLGVSYKFLETKLTPDTVELAHGYDGVCVFVNDVIDHEVIDGLCENGVKVVALRCAGFNNVDVEYAFGRVHVLRVPAYSPYAVAEHAMAMLLTSVRRIHKAYNRTREFNFSLQGLTGFDLKGKTVGVIGTGKIGRVFVDICHGFGMRILAYDKVRFPNIKGEYVALSRLLSDSDVISLHCPLTKETKHLICDETIQMMKRGVVLINTSRGGLIDAEALLNGIKTRHIGAACLDVYEEEGDVFFEDYSGHIVDDDILARLISMPNVLLTSHQAFLTREALLEIAKTTTENLQNFFMCGKCENELCYKRGAIDDCKNQGGERCF
jgi:D-lactate dehydrogenase